MKKILLTILLIIFVTGCSNNLQAPVNDRVLESLMNRYVDAFKKADYNKMQNVMPSFVFVSNITQFSKEVFDQKIKELRETYGDNYNISYVINNRQHLNSDELSKLNELIQNSFKTNELATDCYYLDGTINFSNSNKKSDESLNSYYCEYNNTWYLIIN